MSVFGDLFEARTDFAFVEMMEAKGKKPITDANGNKGYSPEDVAAVIEENAKAALRIQQHGDITQEQLTELNNKTQSLREKLHETFPDGIIPENGSKQSVVTQGEKSAGINHVFDGLLGEDGFSLQKLPFANANVHTKTPPSASTGLSIAEMKV